jgi:hypothetical protein
VCFKNEIPPKRHPVNLTQLRETFESTLAGISVEHFRHLVESKPRQIEAVLRAKMVGRFLMFCALCVYTALKQAAIDPFPVHDTQIIATLAVFGSSHTPTMMFRFLLEQSLRLYCIWLGSLQNNYFECRSC